MADVYRGVRGSERRLVGQVTESGLVYRGATASTRHLIGRVTPLGDVYQGSSMSGGQLVGKVQSSGSVYRGDGLGDVLLNEKLAWGREFDRFLPRPVTESSLVFPEYFLLYGRLVGKVTASGDVYRRQSESPREQLIGEVVGAKSSIFKIGAAALLLLLD